jgi:hypothetical protein
VRFFTFDQPPIDLIGVDIQCASRMSLQWTSQWIPTYIERRTQRRPKLTALLQRTLF